MCQGILDKEEKQKQKRKCETVPKDENEPQDKKLKIEDKKHGQDRKFYFKKVKVETSTKESSVEDLKERVQMKIEKIVELKKDMWQFITQWFQCFIVFFNC